MLFDIGLTEIANYILNVIDNLFNITLVVDSIKTIISGIYEALFNILYEIIRFITYIPVKIIDLVLMPFILLNEKLAITASYKSEIDQLTNTMIQESFGAAVQTDWLVIIYIGLGISLILLLLKIIKKIPLL